MILLKERIGKMLEYLQEQVYPKQVAIPSYKMIRTDERCLDPGQRLRTRNCGADTENITGLRP